MSALGQKQTNAVHQPMSALPSIATAKAYFRKTSCLLYPRKRTCAVHRLMSALGQKRTYDRSSPGHSRQRGNGVGWIMPPRPCHSTISSLRLFSVALPARACNAPQYPHLDLREGGCLLNHN
jgi:hypothetical protein